MTFRTTGNVLKSLKMLDERTVEVIYNDDVTIEIDDIKQSFEYLHEFTKGNKIKKIVVSGKNTGITKEARLYGHEQSLKNKANIIAEAIVVHSLYQKMVVNFYASFIKDSFPTRYFTDVEKARAWIKAH